ncbi:hypothetical protein AMD24_00062 [Candidatus Xiphinematobacter sp. Idaho Grape]|nr:hypothetical protein AMD24_00062 [Candidatus Xiphinematobacter sp. Idaho Grape]
MEGKELLQPINLIPNLNYILELECTTSRKSSSPKALSLTLYQVQHVLRSQFHKNLTKIEDQLFPDKG